MIWQRVGRSSVAVALLAGCGGLVYPETGPGTDGSADEHHLQSEVGSVVARVTLPPAAKGYALDWAIFGATHCTGQIAVDDVQVVEFVVSEVQAGARYILTVTLTNRNGDTCAGTSTPFNVMAGVSSAVGVLIACP
jgi:hypothetical protein